MNKAKKIISILFSLDFLQYAFFFVVTAPLFMSLQPTSTNAVYVFSVYALIVLLYQFWRNPTRLKGSKNLLLMLFMLSYAVTIVLNSKYHFTSNMFFWLFAFASAFCFNLLFVFYWYFDLFLWCKLLLLKLSGRADAVSYRFYQQTSVGCLFQSECRGYGLLDFHCFQHIDSVFCF